MQQSRTCGGLGAVCLSGTRAGSTLRSRTALSQEPRLLASGEGSARSVVQFEGVLPEAAPCVAYAPVDLDGRVGIVVDVHPRYTNSLVWLYT